MRRKNRTQSAEKKLRDRSLKKKIFAVIIILLASLLFLFIYYSNPSGAEIRLLESDEFEQLIKDDNVFVLNTHTPYEGEIKETDAIIEDWQNIAFYENKLPANKNTPKAVYCRSGRMSSEAVKQLSELGYKKIYELKGGMNAWKESGKEIIVK